MRTIVDEVTYSNAGNEVTTIKRRFQEDLGNILDTANRTQDDRCCTFVARSFRPWLMRSQADGVLIKSIFTLSQRLESKRWRLVITHD